MDRRGFLGRLFALSAAAVMPKFLISDEIEAPKEKISEKYKPYELVGVTEECKDKFKNHMSIQRKTYTVTGGPIKIENYYAIPYEQKIKLD